jgi:hypothetical protein
MNPVSPPGSRASQSRPASLRRELWAILTLYAALAVVPLLMGLGCGQAGG